MIVFVDTEFTDFKEPELISLALVAEDGEEFYAERTDFERSKCSDFVNAQILPKLHGSPAVSMNAQDLQACLNAWLQQYRSTPPAVYVAFDYSTDWALFSRALGDHLPPWVCPLHVADFLATKLPERALLEDDPNAHNALTDARALRADWIAAGGNDVTLPLPPNHRELKTQRQAEFLASGHPAAWGIWKGVKLEIVGDVPALDPIGPEEEEPPFDLPDDLRNDPVP